MDMILMTIGVILAKSQPLLALLGLSGSVAAVQLAALAAIALSSIAVTIGILALITYGLNKLIKKSATPILENFDSQEDEPVLEEEDFDPEEDLAAPSFKQSNSEEELVPPSLNKKRYPLLKALRPHKKTMMSY